MAFYDPSSRRVVVRVVYDGPAHAGKTTNLLRLRDEFSPARRGQLVSPETLAGRTLFFDWMHIDGGLVAGNPLRCQLVTVPGQGVLAHRRRRVLRGCDAVIFVCDSSRAGIGLSRAMLNDCLEQLRDEGRAGVPVVVQANKQDLPEALAPEKLREELGLAESVPLVAAAAGLQRGVRETLVLALRAAADRLQADILADGVSGLEGEATSPESLLADLRRADGAGRPSSPVPALLAAFAPSASVTAARAGEPQRTRVAAAPGEAEIVRRKVMGSILPSDDVDSGWVWPPRAGRELLRDLGAVPARPWEPADSGSVVLRAGVHRLVTGDVWCFRDVDEARAALVERVRRRLSLRVRRVGGEVMALQQEERGGIRLWSVTPWLTTLDEWVARSVARDDGELLGAAAEALAAGVAEASLAAAACGVRIDLAPRNFGFCSGRVAFLDEPVATPGAEGAASAAIERSPKFAEIYRRALVDHWSAAPPAGIERLLAVCETLLRPARLESEALELLRARSGTEVA